MACRRSCLQCRLSSRPAVIWLWFPSKVRSSSIERTTAQHARKTFVVITAIDATKETRFVYPCPEVCPPAQSSCHSNNAAVMQVSPNSAIYFYELTSSSSTEKCWTTRFTTTDENGNSTSPPETTQSNGDNIPWVPAHSSRSTTAILHLVLLPQILSSSSHLSSTRTPVPTPTGVNTSMIFPRFVFAIGLVTVSAAFFL